MKTRNVLLTLLVVICIISSCRTKPETDETPPSVKQEEENRKRLKLSLKTDKEEYLLGEKMKVTITLANVSDEVFHKDMVIDVQIPWDAYGHQDVYGHPLWQPGIISKSYREGISTRKYLGMGSYMGPYIVILGGGYSPMSRSIKDEYVFKAREPGEITILGCLNYHALDYYNRKNKWDGYLKVEKTVAIKDEIHPEVVKKMLEAKEQFFSDKGDEYKKAISELEGIGFVAKDVLLELFRNKTIRRNGHKETLLVIALSKISKEAFSEEVYNELFDFSLDKTKEPYQRLYAMDIYETIFTHLDCYSHLHPIIPPDIMKKSKKLLVVTLLNDPDVEISEKALELSRYAKGKPWEKTK